MFPRRGVCSETGPGPQCMSVRRHARVHLCVYWRGGCRRSFFKKSFLSSWFSFSRLFYNTPQGPPLCPPPARNTIVKESLDHVTMQGHDYVSSCVGASSCCPHVQGALEGRAPHSPGLCDHSLLDPDWPFLGLRVPLLLSLEISRGFLTTEAPRRLSLPSLLKTESRLPTTCHVPTWASWNMVNGIWPLGGSPALSLLFPKAWASEALPTPPFSA